MIIENTVIEGRPLVAVDFCIFWGNCGQQPGNQRPVAADAATKSEHWLFANSSINTVYAYM